MRYDLKGYNIDNLLSTLYKKNIVIYNLKRVNYDHVVFEILDKDKKKIKRYIANFKVKTSLQGVKKLPKFLLGNIGIIIGVFLGSILSIFMSNFVWQIKIDGLKNLTRTEILAVLKDNGVQVGKINIKTGEQIESILLNNYDRLAQVSVIKRGSAIIINLSEKLIYSTTEYKPITARYPGIVKEIEVVTGTINVKIGDYINVGDVLVLPFNINSNGEKVGVMPVATIKGELYVTERKELPKEEVRLKRTGKTCKVYNYYYKDKKIFSGKTKNSFAIFEPVVYNEYISDLLPLKREVCIMYEQVETLILHDFDAERDDLIYSCEQQVKQSLNEDQIVNVSTTTNIVDDKMIACTNVKFIGEF